MPESPFDQPGLEVTIDQIVADEAQDRFVLIDVREPHEWEAGRIDGATHIPMDQLGPQIERFDRDVTVVFMCLVGGRSAMAAQAFRGQGFDAWSLAGGIQEWDARGLPLVPEGGMVVGH
jgi:rhodanese-related sulfurtransferase